MFYLQFLTLSWFLLYTTHYSKLHHTTIPHYASLYHIIRYYSKLSSTVLYYTKLYYTILNYIILYDSMLREVNYIILEYTIPHCAVLSCPVLSNTTAHCSQISWLSNFSPLSRWLFFFFSFFSSIIQCLILLSRLH